ncbi:unnamed protein product [Pylaiella littoralis]
MVMDLPPTKDMIMTSWNYLVDLLAAGRARKPTTRTASTFTLARFETWPDRLRSWINHGSVQEVARTRQGNQGTHYLCCIINLVDEELYRVLVEEREKSNTVGLAYPTTIHKISPVRGRSCITLRGGCLAGCGRIAEDTTYPTRSGTSLCSTIIPPPVRAPLREIQS